jgi:hypothetical protein
MQKPSMVLVAREKSPGCHVREGLLCHGYAVMVIEETQAIIHMVPIPSQL